MLSISRLSLAALLFMAALAPVEAPAAAAADVAEEPEITTEVVRAPATPDLRDAQTKLKVQRGNFVAVPIPISDPTLGTGLVAGAAYFYPQTEAQQKVQPASVTAVAGLYTGNKSYAYGVGQQNYWGGDSWRFTGAAGRADLKLELRAPTERGGERQASWLIDGNFLFADIARKIRGAWFVGLSTRYVDINQSFSPSVPTDRYDLRNQVRSVGAGLNVKFDSRDLPLNSYSGQYVEISTLFNDEHFGSDETYQALKGAYRSYHSLTPTVVLAWELEGCKKGGSVPLWDTCRLGLRGFPATEYLAKASASAQLEARWQFRPRWGAVAFGGAGTVNEALAESQNKALVPSVGLGLRWMVLPAKRINLRLDYGRSDGGEAIYFSVGEAF